MTDLVVYLRGQDLSRLHQEEIRRDILEMVLDGQARGQTMEEVVGEDYQTFCQEIVAAVPRRPAALRVLAAVDDVLPALSILLFLWLGGGVAAALAQGGSPMRVPLTVGEVLSMAVILVAAAAVVHGICRGALEGRKTSFGRTWLLALAVLAAVFLPSLLLRQPLAALWLPAAVGIALLPLLLSWLLNRRKDL